LNKTLTAVQKYNALQPIYVDQSLSPLVTTITTLLLLYTVPAKN